MQEGTRGRAEGRHVAFDGLVSFVNSLRVREMQHQKVMLTFSTKTKKGEDKPLEIPLSKKLCDF